MARSQIRAILEDCAFECVEAANDIDALQYTSDHGVDLIVTDIDEPRMDGLNLLSYVANGEFGLPAPPVIVYSALSDGRLAELANAVFRLSKPVRADELIEALEAAFPEP